MWTQTGELPVLWPASGPGQRVRSDSRPCLKRRRQLRAQCQLVAPAEYPISRSGKTGELGWGLADGKYLLVSALAPNLMSTDCPLALKVLRLGPTFGCARSVAWNGDAEMLTLRIVPRGTALVPARTVWYTGAPLSA